MGDGEEVGTYDLRICKRFDDKFGWQNLNAVSNGCFKCKKPGHKASDCNKNKSMEQQKLFCAFCGKPNHSAFE